MAHTEIEKPIEKVKFINPYLDDSIEVQQVVADVGVDDYNLIKGIRLKNGTLTGVICILWKKLSDECRARGIVDFKSTTEFEELIVNSTLVPNGELEVLKEQAAKSSLPKVRKQRGE